MLTVFFKPSFIRAFNGLEIALQEETLEKIELFKHISNHHQLKAHKLHGKLKSFYSFSVNYKYRVLFAYLSSKEVTLIDIGSHKIYN